MRPIILRSSLFAVRPGAMGNVPHILHQFRPCPVRGPGLGNRAIRRNQHDVHGVQYLVLLFFVMQSECLGQTAQIGWICGSKVPVGKTTLVTIQIGQAILAKDARLVIFRVEGDGQQVCFAVVSGGLVEFLLNLRERAAQAGTEIRHGTARIDERNQQCPPRKIRKMDSSAILVDE